MGLCDTVGFNEKTLKYIFYALATVLLIFGFGRVIIVQNILGAALGVLTVLSCIVGIVGVWREIDYFVVGYIAIALFFTLVSGVNLTLDALASPKNATAISFDIIIVLFYAFSGLNGYFLWLFIRQN